MILPAVFSGILATIITLFWQDHAQKEANKNKVFNILMAYRFKLSEYENIKALNSIQVTFYKNKNVLEAWKGFKQETDKMLPDDKRVEDAYIKLLEEVAKACGYKNLKWNEIKEFYSFPSNSTYKNSRSQK